MKPTAILTAFALSLCAADGAVAQDHPALRDLVPLMQVFDGSGPTPGFDVAGIRCAGLYYAQESWRQQNGGRGPSRAELEAGELSLRRSVQQRINEGMSLVDADRSTDADLRRVVELYRARFAENARRGHPWRSDPLLQGDLAYCAAAAG